MAVNLYKESKTKADKKSVKDIIDLLVRNGADPDLETPRGSTYEFSGDENLNREMKKIREEYLKSPTPKTAPEEKPNTIISPGSTFGRKSRKRRDPETIKRLKSENSSPEL